MPSINSFRKLLTLTGFLPLTLLTLLAFGAAPAARAQNSSQQRGFQPGSSYSVSDIESVNNQNGNLMLSIPLASLPAGRGGSPGAGVSLIYNSKLWTSPSSMVPNGGVNPNNTRRYEERHFLHRSQGGGWHYGFRYQVQVLDRQVEEAFYNSQQVSGCPDENGYKSWKVRVHFPDGSTSDFVPEGYEGADFTSVNDGYSSIRPDGARSGCVCTAGSSSTGCQVWSRESQPFLNRTLTYYSTDGRYLRLDIEHDSDNSYTNNRWTLYTSGGTRVVGNGMAEVSNSVPANDVQYVYDRNNNFVRIQGNEISDQLGRSITIQHDDPAAGVDTIMARGFGGAPLKWTVKWKTVTVHKILGTCAPWATCTASALHSDFDFKFPLRVVEQVTLPAEAGGLSYTFTYNGNADPNDAAMSYGWGEVASVTVPSGAKASYAYQSDGAHSLNWQNVLYNYVTVKELSHLREYDGASTLATEKWLYQVGFNGQNTGTPGYSEVIAPDGGKVSHWFYGSGALEGLEYRTVNPDGSMVEKVWKENIPKGYRYPQVINSTGTTMTLGGQKPGANTYVKTEFVSVKDAAGNYVRTAIKDYDYDKNGNVTRLAEYDWVPFADVPRSDPGFGVLGLPQGVPGGAQPLRVTVNSYHLSTPDASDFTTNSPNSYHMPTSARLRNSISSTEIRDGVGQIVSRAECTYDDPATTGNPTLQRSWDSTKGALIGTGADATRLDATNSVSVRNEYDDNAADPALRYGNITLSVDANGNRTKYIYGPVLRPDGTSVTGLYPTTVVAADGTSVQRTSSSVYDFLTGLATRVTDEDNQVSTSTTYDALGRPTLVEEADGEVDVNNVSLERRTVTEYSDALRRVIVRYDLDSTGDGKRVSVLHYDQLGRVRLSRTLEDASTQSATDETAGIKVQTRYMFSGQGSYQLVSNPYRAADSSAAGGEETMGWAVTTSDQGGRVVRAETFSGVKPPAPFATAGANANSTGAVVTAYDAEKVTVTEQAGKQRLRVSDALGRLMKVYEAPNAADYNYLTTYSYDALGNLTQVAQDAQTRTFGYSSLSRLTSVVNPESGRVTYEYDAAGNLKKKVDARHIRAEYDYDALNRVIGRSYSVEPGHQAPAGYVATPAISYHYDGKGMPEENGTPLPTPAHSAGRLTAVKSSISETIYTEFDVAGRVKKHRQVVDPGTSSGQKYLMEYWYDLAGNLTSQKYPSGKVFETAYDNAGRVAGVKNQATGGYYAGAAATDPTNRIKYAAHGAVEEMKLGNGLWEHATFNTRLQAVQIGLGTASTDSSRLRLDLGYGTTNNNGNLRSQSITIAGSLTLSQNYVYDDLNRLDTAREVKPVNGTETETWKQRFTYDQFGNRAFNTDETTDNVEGQQLSFGPINNRITTTGYDYDDAGNVTVAPGGVYRYNAENRLAAANGGGDAYGGASYFYDGQKRRVKKVMSGVTTVYVYDLLGRVIAEYSSQGGTGGGLSYLTHDQMGSARVVTDGNGAPKSRHDYLPFGEEINTFNVTTSGREAVTSYNLANVRHKFTGHERDPETALDYMQARYYSSTGGRFTGADPYNPVVDSEKEEDFEEYLGQPQNWNRYAYVWNNPLKYIDPNGEKVYVVTYTTGNSSGDESFRRAAQTKAEHIRQSREFNGKTDIVILRAVNTKDDFSRVVDEANSLGKQFGQVQQITVYAHAAHDGPIFHDRNGKGIQWTQQEITNMQVNWASTAIAKFYGCNTANFAQTFANTQSVPSYGYEGFAYFSNKHNEMVPDQGGGQPLYLIHADYGRANGVLGAVRYKTGFGNVYDMVRRNPASGSGPRR